MSSSRLDRLLRRISPDVVTRSYLAKFALVVLVVIAAIGAVGARSPTRETTDHRSHRTGGLHRRRGVERHRIDGWTSARRSKASDIADNEAFSRDADVTSRYLRSPYSRTAEEVVALHHVDRRKASYSRRAVRRFRTPAPPSRVRSGSTITCCTATKSPPRRRTRSTASSGSPTSP